MGNVVISPYSAVNGIVLLAQAADGKTLYYLKRRLNFTDTKSDLLDSYVAYQKSLTENARQSIMMLANKLYVQKGYETNPNFQEMAAHQLISGVELVNFTNSIETAKIINDFAAENTQNKVNDIINPESLNAHTRIVLMNTVYMKLSLEKVYQSIYVDKRTVNSFTVHGDDARVHYKEIEYVNFFNGHFQYAKLRDLAAQAIEMRFADSNHSLLLILPDDLKNFTEFETNMKDYDLTTIFDRMHPERVDVKIPTFQIKYQLSLKDMATEVCSTKKSSCLVKLVDTITRNIQNHFSLPRVFRFKLQMFSKRTKPT